MVGWQLVWAHWEGGGLGSGIGPIPQWRLAPPWQSSHWTPATLVWVDFAQTSAIWLPVTSTVAAWQLLVHVSEPTLVAEASTSWAPSFLAEPHPLSSDASRADERIAEPNKIFLRMQCSSFQSNY